MGRLGISNQTRVIAYDERGGIYAARLWWILNHYGHANVALLDGGWTKWTADQRPTDTAVPPPAPRDLHASRPGTVGVATADDVKAAINNKSGQADRRADAERDRRQGPARHQARRLHRVVDPGLLGGHARLRRCGRSSRRPRSPRCGAARACCQRDNVLVYCQVGMRASHDLFTLALLGHDLTKLRNYYGAWEEWGNRDDTPIRTK